MKILLYSDLDPGRLRPQFDKVVAMLERDDFSSAEVKKLTGRDLYRAKLDYSNRLLFRIARFRAERCALILEIVENHAYEKSRFLRGAHVDETKLVSISAESLPHTELAELGYVNPSGTRFALLDKVLSFDDAQEALYRLPAPLIIIGSAGSGKTALTLEKMKLFAGDVLYVTRSAYLARHARNLYFANDYSNETANVEFLSFRELLESMRVPRGREVDYREFRGWHSRQPLARRLPAHKLFEEFKGVLTGLAVDKPWLTREEYFALGVRRSIFLIDERGPVYDLFERYLAWLKDAGRYETNIVAQQYLADVQPRFDFVVVDEVQDLTNVELTLILRLLRRAGQFLLCGDSNQIVHPNFFSWAQVKTLFVRSEELDPRSLVYVLRSNYRNAARVNDFANRLLRVKQRRFGSIDRESNYLVETIARDAGTVELFPNEPKLMSELNRKTRRSTHFAVLVLRDEVKPEARSMFETPLVFSVQEAKGLEYESIILFNFVSSERQSFAAIAEGLRTAEVEAGDLEYSRAADKSDKSLEVYKFFVNALYVAVTRAVRNVYMIEGDTRHPLVRLLGLENAREQVDLGEQQSTLEEWQYEAHRLQQQGKLEQAEDVRRAVLQVHAAPWPVLAVPALAALAERALDPANISNKPRQQLYEYAVYHDEPRWAMLLAERRFEPARGILGLMQARGARLNIIGVNLVKRHHAPYESRNSKEVLRQVDQFGVDFRNPFNHTPLMLAAMRGNVPLVEALLARGADVEIADNHGRVAYHLSLLRALLDADYARGPFEAMARLLAPQAVDLKVDDRLVKLDGHLPEFFLFNAMLALMQHRLNYLQQWHQVGVTVSDFLLPSAHFPVSVLPERRRRRSYLSGVLSRNEISRDYQYNRKLFARTGHGVYVLNPGLELRAVQEWTPIYDRLCPPELDRHLGHRARLEEIIAFRTFYARDPEAAIASLRARFDDGIGSAPGPQADSAGSSQPSP